MKKFNLLFMLVAVATISFLTSCDTTEDGDVSPSLSLVTSGLNANNEIVEGNTFSITIQAAENVTTKKRLTDLVITADYGGGMEFDTTITINDSEYTGLFSGIDAPAAGSTATFTARVTDRDGESEFETLTVTGLSATTSTPLAAAQSFTWERVGGGAGTGLAMFGLSWTSNSGTSAIITEDADKLVILSASEWTSITTKEDLMDAVDNGTGVTQYTGVSATADGTYDDVLATKNGSDYYLINVTAGTVTSSTAGTTITITGDYKE